jgi:3-oxoacyl-[acyl-carrier protein] reductase
LSRHCFGILFKSIVPDRPLPRRRRSCRQTTTSSQNSPTSIPVGRFGTPENIASAVTFLAERAAYITGAAPPVDGGVIRVI